MGWHQEEKHPLFSMTHHPLVLPVSGDMELGTKIRDEEGEGKVLRELWERDAALMALIP